MFIRQARVFLLMALAVVLTCPVTARTVSVGTSAAVPDASVTLPVTVDSVAGLAYLSVRMTYDPQILKFNQATAGSLTNGLDAAFLVHFDTTNGCVSVAAFGRSNLTEQVSATLAQLTFDVLPETVGKTSAVVVASVELGETNGLVDVSITNPLAAANGRVWVTAAPEDDRIPVDTEAGIIETLDEAAKDRIREVITNASYAASISGSKKLVIGGADGFIALLAELGLAPKLTDPASEAHFVYAKPALRIIAFDRGEGRFRFKVSPSNENEIVLSPSTNCVKVYGSDKLKVEMLPIPAKGFDFAPYAESATRGEAEVTAELSTNKFFKVKVEK